MITIVDYDTGNLRSVQNMLRSIGVDSQFARTARELESASRIILPGVGQFAYGMRRLMERDFIGVLRDKVLGQGTPVLGICLGAQLLTRRSDEGDVDGLGWIAADTRHFDTALLPKGTRIPHMGWTDTDYCPAHPIFDGVMDTPRYYYVHSYHMVCDNPSDELCHAFHGYRFTSGIARENIVGVQFHPEKSHRFGKLLLANFAKWSPEGNPNEGS